MRAAGNSTATLVAGAAPPHPPDDPDTDDIPLPPNRTFRNGLEGEAHLIRSSAKLARERRAGNHATSVDRSQARLFRAGGRCVTR
jgi:hypothetical protein